MYYPKNENLYNYDVYPKVFTVGKPADIHIRPLGGRKVLQPETVYALQICALDGGTPWDFPATGDFRRIEARTDENCCICFRYTFNSEQEFFIRILGEDEKKLLEFSVYCVEADLAGRYPFMGDLHMHTTSSDGSQAPAVVCANYRRYGYDFTVISDHERYYPSLDAIAAYKDVPIDLNIVPGEEVHLPRVNGKRNDVHIVNFGGEFSVNALVESTAVKERGKDLSVRAIRTENVPEVMTQEAFTEEMERLAAEIDVPDTVDALPAAMCKWAFDRIKDANGLGIFPHPNWRPNVYHVPERFVDWLFETQPFDAFEVLGGESYYEHNGFQTARYYDEAAKGRRVPIVGSTDSHSSHIESNPKGFICETIIFSPENERTALIESVKKFYSVAIDTISDEFRFVGEKRFVRYGTFLVRHYFPLHDELCFEEGRLMKQYVTGTEEERAEAAALLKAVAGRTQKMLNKYFDF